MTVLCVAGNEETLGALRKAAVGAEWELAPGATTVADAIALIDSERPHVLVVFGPFQVLTRLARERFPAMRILADRDLPGADAVVEMEGVREAIEGRPAPRGPVR